MIIRFLGYFLPVFTLLFTACANEQREVQTTGNFSLLDDSVVNYNRKMVEIESQEIADFLKRYRWNVEVTKTGLRYLIMKQGRGDVPMPGDEVEIAYETRLLSGEVVEQVKPGAPLRFRIGTGKVPNGLEEGLMLMTTGAHAKLVVPSHLAFGLLGDFKAIPNRAVLVYDVELLKIFRSVMKK